MPPAGQFVMDTGTKKNYTFFAAGSGITPIISQVKHLLYNDLADRIVLIFGNKNFGSIIFRDDIENLKDKYLQKLSVHHIFSREKVGTSLHHGRIDKSKCDDISHKLFDVSDVHEFYICGPNDMIFNIRESLESLGVDESRIKYELFNTEGLKKASEVKEYREEYKDKASDIKIKMDGDIFEFSLEYSGQNLLDAAIENGADLPYSCKGGVCCTCKARVLEGEVEMDVNYALEKDEVESGYVLMCQSHPRTERVFIDFDQN
jgi:ring-1,2-phenylacetyl-CoA epoxidase subunit PaaE